MLKMKSPRILTPLFTTALSILMSGCVSFDILKNQNLPENLRQTVIEMRLRGGHQCTAHRYDPTSGTKLTGDVKISTEVTIRRLYLSDTDWVKAEMQANGVIDNIYYSPKSGKFVCGQRNWDSYSDTRNMIFEEFGSKNKTINTQISNTSISTNPERNPYNNDKRSIAVSWDGYQKLISGIIELAPNNKSIGLIKISLPNDEGSCSGQSRQIDQKNGFWSISCTNGMSAAGTYEAYGDGKGATGTGTDAKDNQVRYTISSRN